MYSTRYSVGVNKLGISGQIFEKSSYVTYHENLSGGSRYVAREDEQADRHEEVNSKFDVHVTVHR
jgi:hypothetical protein